MVDAAYLLFLEPPEEEVNRSHTLSQRLLDCAIQTFQPPPTMMHVEILLPPSQSEEHLLHFATYIGAKSGWQLGHKENVGYYLRGENAAGGARCRFLRATPSCEYVRSASSSAACRTAWRGTCRQSTRFALWRRRCRRSGGRRPTARL